MRHWPLFDLRVSTDRLELRLPGFNDLDDLADLAAEGMHDPEVMPFGVPWTDVEPAARARSTVQWQWSTWAEWKIEDWRCDFVVSENGTVVGTQAIAGHDFAITREVSTGSWLGRRYQGHGIGTQMRAAVLHLAFAELGAESATSGAFMDNPASLAVSHKLGYQRDGVAVQASRDRPAVQQRLRLTRAGWEAHRSVPVEIHGLRPCLPLFGLE